MTYAAHTVRANYQPPSVHHVPGDMVEQKWPPRGSLLFAVPATLALWGLMVFTTWYFVG
jgi:hypothetical protein